MQATPFRSQTISPTPMKTTRRTFAKTIALSTGAFSLLPTRVPAKDTHPDDEALEKAATKPVLDRSIFKSPVLIESVEMLRKGKQHFVRVRSKDGAEGVSVDNGRADVL